MPTTPLIPSGARLPAALPSFDEALLEGPIRGVILALYRAVQTLIGIIVGRLTLGQGQHGQVAGYLDAQWLRVTLPTRYVAHPIPHGLGRVPAGFTIWKMEQPAASVAPVTVMAAADYAWTSELIWLATDTTGASFLILLT